MILEDVKLLTDEAMMINMISGIIIIRVVSLNDFSSIYCTVENHWGEGLDNLVRVRECFDGISILLVYDLL